jgi:Domain of unknown function (DUF4388)
VTQAAPATTSDATAAMAAEDEAATKMLMALQRLSQQATLYADNNQAQTMALEAAARAASDYGGATGRNLTIFFSDRAVYVGKRLLRASRSVYAAAAQMREMLGRMGVSQITIGHDVPLDELRILQQTFGKIQSTQGDVPPPSELSRVRLKVGRPPGDYAEFDRLSPDERAIKVYALAIVIVRRFYEQLQRGHWEISAHVRRISEELIALAQQATVAQLAATVGRPPHDDAERAVSAAILALAMAHKLTDDQRLLRWLATAALLCDVGKPRVAGLNPDASRRAGLRMPTLGLDQFAELPGATAFVTSALGRLTDAGMMRSVLVYETLHIEYAEETGPIYAGQRGPAMLSRLLACARRFQLGLSAGRAPGDVIAALVKKADGLVDRWIVQLMMATLSIVPTGTIVELEDGRLAKVMSPPKPRIDFGRPLVRVLDGEGAFVDLNVPSRDGRPKPQIGRVVAATDEDHELRAMFDEDAPAQPVVEEIKGEVLGVDEDEELEWSIEDEDDAREDAEGQEWVPDFEEEVPASEKPAPPQPSAPAKQAKRPLPKLELDLPARPPRGSTTPSPKLELDLPARPGRGLSEPSPRGDLFVQFAQEEPPPVPIVVRRPVSDLPPDSSPDPFAGESVEIRLPKMRPMAQGSFAKTPLLHLLIYALDRKLNGSMLVVEADRRQSAIYFVDGEPAKVKTAALVSPLDRTITMMGLLDEETLKRTLLASNRRKRLHGQTLVSEGLLEPSQLEAALTQQLVNKVGHLMQLPESTRYGYYDQVDLLADYGGAAMSPCDPYPLIMMAVRKYVSWEVLDEVLPRIANLPLELHEAATPTRLGLKLAERMALRKIQAQKQSLNDLLGEDDIDDEAAQRLVYALTVTRSVSLTGGTKRPVGV